MFSISAALALALLAIPSLGNPTALSPRAQIACSLKVTGVLQLRMPDNPNISATGASFVGPQYTVDGVEAQLLKIFAPNNADFEFHMCNSTFMGYTQRPSEFGTTFLYGQLKDKASGLCVTGTHLGGTLIVALHRSLLTGPERRLRDHIVLGRTLLSSR